MVKMTNKKKRYSSLLFLLLAFIGGCGIIVGTVAVVVATVSITGYTIYSGGEAVVDFVTPDGDSDKKDDNSKTVVISRGTFKIKDKHSVSDLYLAAIEVLRDAGMTIIRKSSDELNGVIVGQTSTKENVYMKFELISEKSTSAQIKVGNGNLKQAEYLYDKILELVDSKKEKASNEN